LQSGLWFYNLAIIIIVSAESPVLFFIIIFVHNKMNEVKVKVALPDHLRAIKTISGKLRFSMKSIVVSGDISRKFES